MTADRLSMSIVKLFMDRARDALTADDVGRIDDDLNPEILLRSPRVSDAPRLAQENDVRRPGVAPIVHLDRDPRRRVARPDSGGDEIVGES